jgi:hypothetical protein
MRRFLNARIMRALVIAGGVTAVIAGIGAAPARADWDGDHWRDRGWREHQWREREWREHQWRERERREHEWREWRRHEWLERQHYYGYPRYYYPPASLNLGFTFR